MVARAYLVTAIDGIGIDALDNAAGPTPPQHGTWPNSRRMAFGQSTNVPATQTANQSVEVVQLPAIAAGVTGTVTVANTRVGTNSIFTGLVARNSGGDVTAGRGMQLAIAAIVNATSYVIEYTPTKLMSVAWDAHVEFVNA